MRARKPLIVGNWKMHKTIAQTRAFVADVRARDLPLAEVDAVICPPFTALCAASDALAGTRIGLGAQNVGWAREGAFTGEISAPMLLELGVAGSLVGHSERRQIFGETDQNVGRRVEAALAAGLNVIACVGETLEERDTGRTEDVLRRQLAVLEPEDSLVIAYEPVWAIGTGKTATPEMAQEAHAFVKSLVDVPVLYGGSVKPDNAEKLAAQPDVDGMLVGGASLDVESFAAICRAASR